MKNPRRSPGQLRHVVKDRLRVGPVPGERSRREWSPLCAIVHLVKTLGRQSGWCRIDGRSSQTRRRSHASLRKTKKKSTSMNSSCRKRAAESSGTQRCHQWKPSISQSLRIVRQRFVCEGGSAELPEEELECAEGVALQKMRRRQDATVMITICRGFRDQSLREIGAKPAAGEGRGHRSTSEQVEGGRHGPWDP